MSTYMNNIAQYWSFVFFIIGAFSICFFMLIVGYFLGGKSYSRNKNIPFESGINAVGNSKLHFSVKFYLVAMLFVIFDVEALYLYSWITSIYESGWVGFIEVMFFIFTLLLGLSYILKSNVLTWTKK